MPRVQRAKCPLSDLAAALVGGTAAAGQAAAFTVCELSCSCCTGSITQAADALCTFLATDSSTLQRFLAAANGLEVLQVGLSSSNDTVVCASIRVAGAALQAVLAWRQCCAQAVDSAYTGSNSKHYQQQLLQADQQQQQLDQHRQEHSWLCDDSSLSLQQLKNVITMPTAASTSSGGQGSLSGAKTRHQAPPTAAPAPAAAPVVPCVIANTASHKATLASAVDVSPADAPGLLLEALIDLAGGTSISSSISSSSSSSAAPSDTVPSGSSSTGSCSVDVRAAALLELSQLMLVLADEATQQGSSHDPDHRQPDSDSAGGSQGPSSNTHTSSAGSSYVLGMSWVESVLQASMEALAQAEATLRRAASQALAAALVLQEATAAHRLQSPQQQQPSAAAPVDP